MLRFVTIKGQWVLGFEDDFTVLEQDAVGLQTPVAAVQVLCAMPMKAEDIEVGRLIQFVRLQAVIRREAKKAKFLNNAPRIKTYLDHGLQTDPA
jgi:hypothetical protein